VLTFERVRAFGAFAGGTPAVPDNHLTVATSPSSDFVQPRLNIYGGLLQRFVAAINTLGNRAQGLSNLDGVNA